MAAQDTIAKLLETGVGRRMLQEAEAEERVTVDARRTALLGEIGTLRAESGKAIGVGAERIGAAEQKVRTAEQKLDAARQELARARAEVSSAQFVRDRRVAECEAALRESTPECVAALGRELDKAYELLRHDGSGLDWPRRTAAVRVLLDLAAAVREIPTTVATAAEIEARCAEIRAQAQRATATPAAVAMAS